jgi:hypothetical protein
MIPASAIQRLPWSGGDGIALLSRDESLTTAPSIHSLPFQRFPITAGSAQEHEHAMDILRQLRQGVRWWARLIEKQSGSPPGATAWLLWYEQLAGVPSHDPTSPSTVCCSRRRRGFSRLVYAALWTGCINWRRLIRDCFSGASKSILNIRIGAGF